MGGYVTTDDTSYPEDPDRRRPLRIPNREVSSAYRREIVLRAARVAGSMDRLDALHDAFALGDAAVVQRELALIAANSASYYDFTSENACHMLLLGLLFGVTGYRDPVSNREAGYGRFDVQLVPWNDARGALGLPVITVEVKFMAVEKYAELGPNALQALQDLADEAVGQIADREYDGGCAALHWGIAFAGKRVAVVCNPKDPAHIAH